MAAGNLRADQLDMIQNLTFTLHIFVFVLQNNHNGIQRKHEVQLVVIMLYDYDHITLYMNPLPQQCS